MGIPDRFREPVALVEASVFGALGVVFALFGPWPWLALAAPVIFLVVLLVSTRHRPRPAPPDSEQDVAGIVGGWARSLADGDPAFTHAERVVGLAGEVEALILKCKQRIRHIDDRSTRAAATESLRAITNHLSKMMAPYVAHPPAQAHAWDAFGSRLRTVHGLLGPELDKLSRRS